MTKGTHLLIDENYNITGIIDWQFARIVPVCEAFGPLTPHCEPQQTLFERLGTYE